jgi:long-chain acyl-CoA synthetase
MDISWRVPLPTAVRAELFLQRAADLWPEQPAIDFYDFILTYHQVCTLARRVANGLRKLGVGPQTRVALHLPNTPHYVIAFFGVLYAGGCVVNIGPAVGQDELKLQLDDSWSELAITSDSRWIKSQLIELQPNTTLRYIIICSEADFRTTANQPSISAVSPARQQCTAQVVPMSALINSSSADHVSLAQHDPDHEVALLQYTGGTTGIPKAAMLTHANLSAMVHIYTRWGWRRYTRDGLRQRRLATLPMSHVVGVCCNMLLSIATGTEIVLHEHFDPERVLRDIHTKRITIYSAVPSAFSALAACAKSTRYDLSSLQVCSSAGAPLHADTLNAFSQAVGVTLSNGYGLTEVTTVGTTQLLDGPQRSETVGLPLPNTDVHILNATSGDCTQAPGIEGEVCIEGPQVMRGYWNAESETQAAFVRSMFRTGDIGYFDDDGYLLLLDRAKDVLTCGGFKVYPNRVERVIAGHPAVSQAAIAGVADSMLGQTVRAFVVLKVGATLTLAELRSFLAKRLAWYEMPGSMEILDRMPITEIGKLARKDLIRTDPQNPNE